MSIPIARRAWEKGVGLWVLNPVGKRYSCFRSRLSQNFYSTQQQ